MFTSNHSYPSSTSQPFNEHNFSGNMAVMENTGFSESIPIPDILSGQDVGKIEEFDEMLSKNEYLDLKNKHFCKTKFFYFPWFSFIGTLGLICGILIAIYFSNN